MSASGQWVFTSLATAHIQPHSGPLLATQWGQWPVPPPTHLASHSSALKRRRYFLQLRNRLQQCRAVAKRQYAEVLLQLIVREAEQQRAVHAVWNQCERDVLR